MAHEERQRPGPAPASAGSERRRPAQAGLRETGLPAAAKSSTAVGRAPDRGLRPGLASRLSAAAGRHRGHLSLHCGWQHQRLADLGVQYGDGDQQCRGLGLGLRHGGPARTPPRAARPSGSARCSAASPLPPAWRPATRTSPPWPPPRWWPMRSRWQGSICAGLWETVRQHFERFRRHIRYITRIIADRNILPL